MKKIKKSVPVSPTMNYEIKEVAGRLNISDATLCVIAIERLLKDIKKGALKKSDLIGLVLDER